MSSSSLIYFPCSQANFHVTLRQVSRWPTICRLSILTFEWHSSLPWRAFLRVPSFQQLSLFQLPALSLSLCVSLTSSPIFSYITCREGALHHHRTAERIQTKPSPLYRRQPTLSTSPDDSNTILSMTITLADTHINAPYISTHISTIIALFPIGLKRIQTYVI